MHGGFNPTLQKINVASTQFNLMMYKVMLYLCLSQPTPNIDSNPKHDANPKITIKKRTMSSLWLCVQPKNYRS